MIPNHVHTIITLPGSGTMKERVAMLKDMNNTKIVASPNIEEAVRLSIESANKGDKIVFSPGFGARGDGNRKERGEKFVRAVKSLQ
jgi:UDP-N-acetylmuramoylalanine-D-glutamate ligase